MSDTKQTQPSTTLKLQNGVGTATLTTIDVTNQRVTISSSGKVGITPLSPAVKLHLPQEQAE